MSRFPWLRMRRKTAPELPLEPPILLGNKSNGEFFWEQTPRERRMRQLILQLADERSRKLPKIGRRCGTRASSSRARSAWRRRSRS